MSVDEVGELSVRELMVLTFERIDSINTKMDSVVSTVDGHTQDINSLKETRASNSGFFRGINWIVGIPGILALIFTGKSHL